MIGATQTNLVKQLKPRDVEEPIDFYLHRPLAAPIAAWLEPTRITPNQVTYAAAVLGLLAGAAVAAAITGPIWLVPLGGALLFGSILLDCADGQLARLRGQSSMVGRALDGVMDIVPVMAVFFGFAIFLLGQPDGSFLRDWTLGLVAGFSFPWHTKLYDHAKNVYLHQTRSDVRLGGSALASMEEIEAELKRCIAEGRRWDALMIKAFRAYTRGQRKRKPELMDPPPPLARTDAEREIYRRIMASSMRLWSWLGLGTHLALFWATTLLTPLWPTVVRGTWWLMIVPLNLVAVWLLATERQRTRRVEQALRDHRDALGQTA